MASLKKSKYVLIVIPWTILGAYVYLIFSSSLVEPARLALEPFNLEQSPDTEPKSTDWTSQLPPQIPTKMRLSFGSSQQDNARCGATVYVMTKSQLELVRIVGAEALPKAMVDQLGSPYSAWKKTPVSAQDFEQYVFNSGRMVGLNCSHGSWEKEWRTNASSSGGYYTVSDNSLILLNFEKGRGADFRYIEIGIFYNRGSVP